MRFALLLVASCLPFAVSEIAASAQPNVLFLISDDLTAEALACYGNEQVRTPNIDSLAKRGVKFTRTYCQFPICGPSRAALMSGMYAQSIGVTGNGASTRFTKNLGDRPSMAEHFKNNGYHTARVSKIYHMRVPGDITKGVAGPDHAASWNEAYNMHAPEWMTEGEAEHLSNEKLKFDRDKHYSLGFGPALYSVKASDASGAAQADVQAASQAVEILNRQSSKKPFFLAVGFVRPHVPLVAPAHYFERYPADDMKLAFVPEDDLSDIPRIGQSRLSSRIGLTEEDQHKALQAYYACVEFMDDQVGRVLEALEESGHAENTIVVFTSDHGYLLGEHHMWQKMNLHEESVRIPLIFSAPDGLKDETADTLAEQIDIYPTLADLAGFDIPPHCQGVSLAPALKDPDAQLRETAYSYHGNGHMLRTDRWAYIRYKNGEDELYDMQEDPGQFVNLVGDAEEASVLKLCRQQLQEHLKSLR
ncbi:sulfatase [Stratiformator vulcanicus]|uniref:Arylsulfatase n=1 Tax=Stratiformator vulcanicus TaxID=2527980 RepID=A0A517R7I8_9PLAN|nr:sulfatase [Stratiformator vulcanicus]QDT39857.1 Arylsulfatase [Stratiformator vulcanicus]